MAEPSLAQRLADFGLELKGVEIPHGVVKEVKRRLIDTFACMLGAYWSKAASIARLNAGRVSEGPSATVFGSSVKAAPEAAAFANGVMMRYLDYNDTYLSLEPAHPSDNFSAILAAAEVSGKGGADIIKAAIAAYEVQCRLCDAASIRAHGWDHVSYGAFSATLAVGMLFDLDRAQIVNALGIAGTIGPAMRQTRSGELSMWKGCAFANVARNAVFTATLAKDGLTGPAPVFEGTYGFMKLVSGPFGLPAFCTQEGAGYKILDTFVKYYPVEYHAQSAVGAAIELSKEIGAVDDIESITVSTCAVAYDIIGSGAEKRAPATRESADHSLAYCVAAALMDGTVKISSFEEARLKDTTTLSLVGKVKVEVSAQYDDLYPAAVPNSVEVLLKSGKRLFKEILYPKGHAKNALSDDEVEEKFMALGAPLMTEKELRKALGVIWRLEELNDAGELIRLFADIKERNR